MLLNVFLVKDSHDFEKMKKMPLFCKLPFKGSIHRVLDIYRILPLCYGVRILTRLGGWVYKVVGVTTK